MLIIGETGVQNLCKQNCSKIKSLIKKWENVTTKLFKNSFTNNKNCQVRKYC